MKPDFLTQKATEAAPQLLGWVLCRQTKQGIIKAKIVETEAYHQSDPASHSFRGLTARTAPMFEAGGTIYVYFNYGMHYAINLVAGRRGEGEGVLLRAAEPLAGLDIMRTNRGTDDVLNLCSGPGKLAQAFGIRDTKFSGKKLGPATLWLEPPSHQVEIATSPRIGISKAVNQHWRFYEVGSKFTSRPPTLRAK